MRKIFILMVIFANLSIATSAEEILSDTSLDALGLIEQDLPVFNILDYGGVMKNVIIRNIKMDVVGCPIFIKLGDRQRPTVDANGREIYPDKVGIIQDVHISGIHASVDDVHSSTFRDMESESLSQTALFRIKPNCKGIDAGEDNR